METTAPLLPSTPASLPNPHALANPLDVSHPLATGGGPSPSGGGEVTLAAGLYVQRVSAAGLTVALIRDRFRARMSIEERAVAVVNGAEVGPDTVLQAGQTLTFVRRAGERG